MKKGLAIVVLLLSVFRGNAQSLTMNEVGAAFGGNYTIQKLGLAGNFQKIKNLNYNTQYHWSRQLKTDTYVGIMTTWELQQTKRTLSNRLDSVTFNENIFGLGVYCRQYLNSGTSVVKTFVQTGLMGRYARRSANNEFLTGKGALLGIRPGVSFNLTDEWKIEILYGFISVNFMEYFKVTNGLREKQFSNVDFNSRFNLRTVMIGGNFSF